MASGVHWVSDGRVVPPPPGRGLLRQPSRSATCCSGRASSRSSRARPGTTLRWSMFSRQLVLALFRGGVGARRPRAFPPAVLFRRLVQRALRACAGGGGPHPPPHPQERRAPVADRLHPQRSRRTARDVPPLLKQALRDNAGGRGHLRSTASMIPSSQRFRVARVGPQSTIAKLWGVSPVSYPCLTGHSYDQAVSRVYPQVTPHRRAALRPHLCRHGLGATAMSCGCPTSAWCCP